MKKSSCIEAHKDGLKLLQPLQYADDYTYIKRHTKRVILEIIETIGKVTIGFSGGTDSLFMVCCARELVEEGKLARDAYEIVYLKLDFSKMKQVFEDVPLPTVEEQIILDFIDSYVDKVLTITPTINELLDFYNKEVKELSFNKLSKIHTVLAYARTKLDNYCLAADGFIDYLNYNYQGFLFWRCWLREDGPEIDIYSWDIDIHCSLMKKNQFIIKDNHPHKYNQLMYLQTKHIDYIRNFPETILGLPKRQEYPWMYLGNIKLANRYRFFKQIPFLQHNGGPPCLLYLPNGEKVTSVEQTQEFFNRHS